MKADYYMFSGEEDGKIEAKQGQTITINFESKVDKGNLVIKVITPEGEEI